VFHHLISGFYLARFRPRNVADGSAPMQRATVPEADREIGVRHPVLSHGFVALVDYMGNDAAIVQAARVSYGQGTKSVRDDRGLIRYLMRHRHTTPFEMVEYKFLVRLPIFVARQWIRHRTACLAEGTQVIFDLPGGVSRRGNQAYPLKIEDLWRRFQPSRTTATGLQRNPFFRRDRVRGMLLRQLDEDSQQIRHTHILDVSRSGRKPVFRMSLDDGKWIDCTADHRFLFDDGWNTLAAKTGLREFDGRAVWDVGEHQLLVNGAELVRPALYQDRNWLEREYARGGRSVRDIAEACGVLSSTVELWIRRFNLPRPARAPFQFQLGNNYYTLRKSTRGISQKRAFRGTGEEPYASRAWLEKKWVTEGLSAGQIAKECGASLATIRKWLRVHGLTNHPAHDCHPRFPRGHIPWNRGKTYRIGPRPMTPTRLATVRAARAGPESNFWKGGVSSDREGIGRWTTQIARSIHERNHWTCQLCHRRKSNLRAHHIVPVWADLSLARDPSNLTTLCDECHREVHKDERAYVGILGGPPVEGEWVKRPRVAWNRLTVPRLARIEKFEFLGERMTYDIEVEGPSHNFVANGIVTHNSVNEYSARYSIIPDEFEVPPEEEVRHQSSRNRQGRGDSLPSAVVDQFRSDLERISKDSYAAYTRALDAGVARETARLLLPVAYYTQWYWKCDLWNLFHFLSLRLDPHAQEEIRLFAAEMAKIARLVAPIAFEAFEELSLSALSLSRREQVAVRALLEGKTPEAACAFAGLPLTREDGKPMTSGEGVEFLEKLARLRSSE
jgi:thymidylate synthase (FAD)